MAKDNQTKRRFAIRGGAAVLTVGLALTPLGASYAGATHHTSGPASEGPGKAHASALEPAAQRRRSLKVPDRTTLAHLEHRTNGYRTPTSRHPNRRVHRRWHESVSVLPVIAASGHRVEVLLPQRPNESTTWMNVKAVRLSRTNQAILIDLSARRLYLFKGRQQIGSFPIGIGKPSTPTPTGVFFLALYARAPEAGIGYGPLVLNTSAHSDAIRDFEGGNDALIAIHGPIGAGREIGKHGAAISHGCIRMHVRQLKRLYFLPMGTPIIVTK
jgi:lipoprotein-anchoring transpeptidase ErfK/SrfK